MSFFITLFEPAAPNHVINSDFLGDLELKAFEVLPLGRGEIVTVGRLDVEDELHETFVRLVQCQSAAYAALLSAQ